jgi:RNA polymerase sigma factor (sigma-70 family)
MEKHLVDRIIMEYVRPLYGFALNKTGNIAEAEELASRITLEVYQSLLRKPEVHDPASYIFKIAHYVWARHIGENARVSNHARLEDHEPAYGDAGFDAIIDRETAGELRREIAFLSRQQREIVIKYYYGGMSIRDIAASTGLSGGTVKWHLFEAKKELRSNMNAIRSIGNLGVNPIRMAGMGHCGSPGSKGDTADFLSTTLRQNIAYAAYHKPLTIREIAEELGVSPVFVEDEVAVLEEYGFLDRLPGGKYRTNMYIEDPSAAKSEALHRLFGEYAGFLVERYFRQFFTMAEAFLETGIYVPGGDANLLMWSLAPYAGKLLTFPELDRVTVEETFVKRKDGGHYIATARIARDFEVGFDPGLYMVCGDMERTSDEHGIYAWQIDTHWCGREGNWRDCLLSDFVSLGHFINGNLPQNEANLDVYRRLLDKQYLIRTDAGYEVNIVYCRDRRTGERLRAAIPQPSDDIRKAAKKLDEEVYRIHLEGQPEHVRPYVQFFSQNMMGNSFLRPYVLKALLDAGLLKAPEPHRQKGISTILFINRD